MVQLTSRPWNLDAKMNHKTLLLCFGIFELVSANYYCIRIWENDCCERVQSEDLPLTNWLKLVDSYENYIRWLNIYASTLREIPENAFNGFSALRTLYLVDNKIESVADGAFNGLRNLVHLYLDGNDLTSLSLSAMPGLRGLFIGRNKISTLELKLDELRNLDISSNLLTNLTFLEHLPKLEWLNVSSNGLSCVDEDIFRDLPLKYVYLGDNPWQNGCGTSLAAYFEGRNVTVRDKDHIAEDSRCDFDYDSRIYSCDGMQSEDLPLTNPHENNVTTLKMSNSTLREIPENAFNGFPSLRTLQLVNNDIESVADGAFNGLPNLEELVVWRLCNSKG